MSEKTHPTELGDSLRSQMSVDSQPKEDSSKLMERERIDHTPFDLVGNEEMGYFVVLGKYKVSQNYGDKNAAIDDARYPAWDILLNVITLAIHIEMEERQLKSTASKIKL